MIFRFKYGKKEIPVKINSGKLLGVLEQKKVNSKIIREKELIKKAIIKKLTGFVNKDDKVGIVIPDKTRKAGVKIYLPIILKILDNICVPKENITIMIASGAHTQMTDKEINDVTGNIGKKYKIISNNAFDKRNFFFAGKTKRGTPVYLNKELNKFDKIIATSSILYHYFAGYGGGPKIIMPGLASKETIEINHKMSLTSSGGINPKCRNGNIQNNPVYNDIAETVKKVKNILYIGTIIDTNEKIIKVNCGDILEEHKRGGKYLDSLFKKKLKEKADAVLCSAGGFPKDINIIQTHKSIHNAYNAVKKNGTIICFAECSNGIGSETFMEHFQRETCAEIKEKIISNYSLNAQTALSFRYKLDNVNLILISNLNPIHFSSIQNFEIIKPTNNIGKMLNELLKYKKYYVIPSANSILLN